MESKPQIALGWRLCGSQVFSSRPHKQDTHLVLPGLLRLSELSQPQCDKQHLSLSC